MMHCDGGVGNVPALQPCETSRYQITASHFHPPPFKQELTLKLPWTLDDDFRLRRASYQTLSRFLPTRVKPSQPTRATPSKSQANAPSSSLLPICLLALPDHGSWKVPKLLNNIYNDKAQNHAGNAPDQIFLKTRLATTASHIRGYCR